MTAQDVKDAIEDATPFELEAPLPLVRPLPPADPFPMDALGSILAKGALGIYDRVQAPYALCGQSVLAAATLAVQSHADIELPTGHIRPLSSFFLTIAATGERKSACDAEALWAVRKHEAHLRESYSIQLESYQNDKMAWEKSRDQVIRASKQNRQKIKLELDVIGPAPSQPLFPTLTCPDPTVEGLFKLFAIGQPSLGVFSAEGGQFIGGHGMAEDNKLRTAAGLSGLWDGEIIRRIRASDGASIMPGRRCTLHLMVQPDVANLMLTDRALLDQGMLSRMLVTAPDSASGTRFWREAAPDAQADLRQYQARLLHILETPFPLCQGKSNELCPRTLPLSADARKLWIDFSNRIEKQMGKGGSFEPILGLANKLAEHAARLAGVLELTQDLHASSVSGQMLAAGIELAQHYANEALRLFSAQQQNADLLMAQRALDWMHHTWAEPAISLPDLYQYGPNAIRDKKTAQKIVSILEDHRWVTPISGPVIIKGNRRREAWAIPKENTP